MCADRRTMKRTVCFFSFIFLIAQYETGAPRQGPFNSTSTIPVVSSTGRSLSAPLHTLMEPHAIYPPYANLSLHSPCCLEHRVTPPSHLPALHLLLSPSISLSERRRRREGKKHPLTIVLLECWVGESKQTPLQLISIPPKSLCPSPTDVQVQR